MPTFDQSVTSRIAVGQALGEPSEGVAGGIAFVQPPRVQAPINSSFVERFLSGHGWVNAASTAASIADDTTDVPLGGGRSLTFTTKTDGTAASVEKTGLTINATGKQFRVWLKCSDISVVSSFIFYAGDAGFTNYYQWQIGGGAAAWYKSGEWVAVTLNIGAATLVGTPDRATLSRLRMRCQASSGNAVVTKIGGVALIDEPAAFPNGVVSITCDDIYASEWSLLRPVLDKYGYPATLYAIPDRATGDYIDMDRLHQLEEVNGWEIAGHGLTDLTTLSASERQADLASMRQWLVDNGFRGRDHYCYPQGGFDADVIADVRKLFSSARTVLSSVPLETLRPADPFRLRSLSVVPATTAATVTGHITKAYDEAGWFILTFHDITTGTAGTNQWEQSKLVTVIDHIASTGIPVRTVGDVLRTIG